MWNKADFSEENTHIMLDNIKTIIKRVMEEDDVTQVTIAERCRSFGGSISQGTISNLIRGEAKDIKLSSLISLCKGLGVSFEDIMPGTQMEKEGENRKDKPIGIDKKIYKGYPGTYYTYFFPTISNKEDLLRGKLKIGDPAENGTCSAHMKLYTGDIKTDENGKSEEIIKEYKGEFSISIPMQSGYCILKNDQSDECCFLIFHHFYLLNNDLKCRVAVAATTSAGGNRRPTIHRIYLSRDRLNVQGEKFIRGQLRLNESEILITKEAYAEMLKKEEIPEKFAEIFEKEAKLESYYTVVEARLTNCGISKEEFARVISLLRDYSVSPKYNKVSMKTDEFVFENYENWKES